MIPLPPITKKTWRIKNEQNLSIEVTLHAEGEDYTPRRLGIYCYYIYIHESYANGKFDQLWLEDRVSKIADDRPERVSNDYYSLPLLNSVEFAGGITYYDKRGYTPGHRCVVLGCDYNHIWNEENPPDLGTVICDAINTAMEVRAWLDA